MAATFRRSPCAWRLPPNHSRRCEHWNFGSKCVVRIGVGVRSLAIRTACLKGAEPAYIPQNLTYLLKIPLFAAKKCWRLAGRPTVRYQLRFGMADPTTGQESCRTVGGWAFVGTSPDENRNSSIATCCKPFARALVQPRHYRAL